MAQTNQPQHISSDRKILTVGQLRRALEGLPDDLQVMIGTPEAWDHCSEWLNVEEMVIPSKAPTFEGDDNWVALSLMTADTWDSRQF